jgi:transcriptional/translational regulatory protein YebC/TACO1
MVEAAIEAGADDVESSEEGHILYCHPDQLHQVAKVLEARFGEPRSARILRRPKSGVPVDEEAAQKLLRMIEALEDSDDVQDVYTNFEIADEVLERLSA